MLDEFDALLQYKAHSEPTSAIIGAIQRQRRDSLQTILCSATASDLISDEKNKLEKYIQLRPNYSLALTDTSDVNVSSGTTKVSRTAIHGVIHLSHKYLALETLRRVLNTSPAPQQVLIFVDHSRRADIVVSKLFNMGIIAAALSGNDNKGERTDVNKALREGRVGIVVATELAARGIDAPYLTHVINLDLPTDASHYAHRAGRCGRGNRPGVVVNITTDPRERNVPLRFAQALDVKMHAVEPRKGLLKFVDGNVAVKVANEKSRSKTAQSQENSNSAEPQSQQKGRGKKFNKKRQRR